MKKLRKKLGSQNYFKGLTRSQQNQFAQTMGELLLTGFSLQESLYLLLTIRSFQPAILANIQHQLKEGQPFSEVLSQTGYGAEQLVQIELAELHGNLPATLLEIAKQLRLVEGFRNDLKKLLAYPMLLLTFLLGILFSMRLIVLPQLIGFRDGYRRALGDSADTSLSLVRSTIYPSGYFIDFASKVSADEIVSY